MNKANRNNRVARFTMAFLFDDSKVLLSPCSLLFAVCAAMALGIAIGLSI